MAKTDTSNPSFGDLLPDPQVAQRYSVTPRTLYRWDEQPELDFPKPIRINHRKFRRVKELESWERRRASGKARKGISSPSKQHRNTEIAAL